MKIIAILIVTLAISQSANAAQTCMPYITDEWPVSRYTVETISGENVVTDDKTGLMWKQCSEGLSGSTCSINSGNNMFQWNNSLDIADSTDFAGFTDWRLPNIEEIRSIVAANCYNPSINEIVFPNTPSVHFWSSSPVVYDDGNTFMIGFYNGDIFFNTRQIFYNMRLVRFVQ